MACPPPQFDWLSWATWSCLREDIVPVATFIGAAIIAAAAFAQAKTARRRHEAQTETDRERQITESFAKAIEQLGSDKLEIRLGGIYSLERIARESEREYWPIMETVTAFVRKRAPWPPPSDRPQPVVHQLQRPGGIWSETTGEKHPYVLDVEEPQKPQIRPETDIQAILTVLGRRDEQARKQDKAEKRYLDLRATNLRGADLWGAHLEGTDFTRAYLNRADLRGAHLEGAYFTEAHLENVRLNRAHLEGADLEKSVGLTQEDLGSPSGDDRTTLPPGLTRPAHWSKSEGRDGEPDQ